MRYETKSKIELVLVIGMITALSIFPIALMGMGI